MDGHVSPLINVQLCSEVVVRRRSELDERISKSDMGITVFLLRSQLADHAPHQVDV